MLNQENKPKPIFLYFKISLLLSFILLVGCIPGRRPPPRNQTPSTDPTPTLISTPTNSPSPETSQPTPSIPLPQETDTPLALDPTLTPSNILLIIADDMGIDASPCYDLGLEKPSMPNLERLCHQGLVFEQVWATPACSSTRATLLTGRYGFRTGIGSAIGPNTPAGGISLAEVTIQQFLKENAPLTYRTAVIGKWHLSDRSNGGANNPTMMGIDHYAGLLAGVHDDYAHWQRTEAGQTQTVTDYSTTAFTNEAIIWLAQQQQPWFLWLAYTAPHEPFHLPPPGLHQRPQLSGSETDIKKNPFPYYLAMMESLDYEIGRLLDSLPAEVRHNTIIIFLGDNGTPNRVVQAPFTGKRAKGTIFEGGVHVPLIIAGAGVTRPGQRESALINTTDFWATLAELAAIPHPNRNDSLSFAPLLTQAGPSPRNFAYTEFFGTQQQRQQQDHGWAIRDARFKLIVLNNGDRFFYDLSIDPAEQTNLLSGTLDETATQRLTWLEERAFQLRSE